ncbi:MAG TPA: GAF domain-containing protein [Thermoanaerobaculia bacterium]|nr:GAF domain-containing protein [Thermoanaerobaculia bacterium]
MKEAGTKDAVSPRLQTAGAVGGELVDQLRSTLERANELVRALESNLREAAAGGGDGQAPDERASELERRLATAESDVKELASRLVDSEHQGGRLMNLYVATYQLHSTLEPAEVQATIAEIAINLLGAQQFVLLLRRDEGEGCEIALREGVYDPDQVPGPPYDGTSYSGGDAMVDATLADGVLRLGPTSDSPALAAVPLRVHNEIVGALVVLKLLDHKPILRAEDRDLLDLLSAHAAVALFAARLFATKDRKLRTLESLVKLARGE